MNIELEQLYGTWRHKNGEAITDIAFRFYESKTNKGYSLFTIFNWTEEGSNIIYEWQGIPEIVNHKNNISDIKSIELINTYIQSDKDSKLAVAFLSMFISNNTIVLPDFIFNENIELKNKLR